MKFRMTTGCRRVATALALAAARETSFRPFTIILATDQN